MPSSVPVKHPIVLTKSLDDSPVSTVARGRKSKFTNNEINKQEKLDKPVMMESGGSGMLKVDNDRPPKPPSRRKSHKKTSGQIDACEVCTDRVFLMQRLSVEGHMYHRSCFKCSKCNEPLQSKSYEYDIQEDKFYCRPHFRDMNRQKSIKRTMAARGIQLPDEGDIPLESNKKPKEDEEWDIISTPPHQKNGPLLIHEEDTPVKLDVPSKQSDDVIKRELPSLLSALAQKKKLEETHERKTEVKKLPMKGPLRPPLPSSAAISKYKGVTSTKSTEEKSHANLFDKPPRRYTSKLPSSDKPPEDKSYTSKLPSSGKPPEDKPYTSKLPSSDKPPEDKPPRRYTSCLLYTSPSPRDRTRSRMPSSA